MTSPASSHVLLRAFASLRGNPRFALLWVSNLFFFGGVWGQTLVLGWLAFEITGSELLVAVFSAARLSPLLLGPLAGMLADRFHRVRLLLIAAGWAAVTTAILAVAAGIGELPFWLVVAGGLALGLAQSPSQPARMSLVVDLVRRENVSNANALNALAINATQVIGPGIGGVLLGVLGAPAALWVSAGLYVVSLAMLVPLRGVGTAATSGDHTGLREILGGFRTITANPLAASVLLVTLAANILVWPVFQSFMPVFAGRHLGLGAGGLSALMICSGVGGLVSALVIAGLGDFRRKGAVFVIGTAVWAGLWALFALSTTPTLSFVLMVCVGLASSTFGVLQSTLMLLITDPPLHGRALGLQELAIGVMPLSSLVLGAIAEGVGVGPTTFVSTSLMIVFLAVLSLKVPQLLRYTGDRG